jgi:hypothetical protein
MKRWMIAAGVLVVLGGAGYWAWRASTDTTQITREIQMRDVREIQVGDAKLILVPDNTERLVLRTTRRQLPWVLTRQNGSLADLVSGPDDADPRALILMLGMQTPSDPVEFELHTAKVTKVIVAGGASLLADNTKGRSLDVAILSNLPSEFRNVALRRLHVSMQGGGRVKASGTVDDLSVTELAAGRFDGASLRTREATVSAAASGIAVIDVAGKGPTTFTATE